MFISKVHGNMKPSNAAFQEAIFLRMLQQKYSFITILDCMPIVVPKHPLIIFIIQIRIQLAVCKHSCSI